MRICVFGASGPVGRATVRLALQAGHDVTAVTRRPQAFAEEASRLRLVRGDVLDPDQVESAIRGTESVISTIGVDPSRRPVLTYSVGVRNMLTAMRTCRVDRIVCVSSKNLAEGSRDDPILFRLVLSPFLHLVNRTIYQDMHRMERLLRDSDRAWTVLRPAGLFAAQQVSRYRCGPEHSAGVFTSTVDLADALLAEAVADRPHAGPVLEVLTDTGTPTLLGLIAGQRALHRR